MNRDEIAPDSEFQFDERHSADAEYTHADVSKASELLGYAPTQDIREDAAVR